jgi:RNA polymerase sigma-70 factor (ECF subfamily)
MSVPFPDTDQLLDQASAGDAAAAERLIARHRPRLKRMVAARIDPRLSRRIDPSDVVQEALLEAHRQLPQYLAERPVAFYPWLRALAWNRMVDLHRRHLLADRRALAREEEPNLALSDDAINGLAARLAASGTSPVQRALREEQRAAVRRSLGELAVVDREVLLLRFVEQLPVAEAAGVLGISAGAFKTRQVRALARLQKLLTAQSEGSADGR